MQFWAALALLVCAVSAFSGEEASGDFSGEASGEYARFRRYADFSGEESGEASGVVESGEHFRMRRDVESSGIEYSGIESSGIESSGIESSGIESSGIESSGAEYSGQEASGEMFRMRRDAEASGEASGEESSIRADDKECVALAACSSNDDCLGGKCLGLNIGKCDCNAVASFLTTCQEDSDCGGLKHSCDLVSKRCNKFGAFNKLGLDFMQQFSFCSSDCDKENRDKCNGLPCSTGNCACPIKEKKEEAKKDESKKE